MTLFDDISTRRHLHEPRPVFNKRLFRAQAGIVVTNETLRVLKKPLSRGRSEEELHALKSVVSGLKTIHKGLQIIKEALCYCVNYERVEGNVDITKQREEEILSCYYILSGSVEGKYTVNNDGLEGNNSRNGCNISYIHVAGEYLGLVSSDGPKFDLPPPDEMRSMESCEFLRIDRQKFHQTVKWAQNRYVKEIEHYIRNASILSKLPDEDKNKLVPLMTRQEYHAGRVIINQGEIPEHLFFVSQGRCQYYRKIYIEEVNREELVKLGQVEEGEFFGESTVMDNTPSFCSVASIGTVTCYLINIWTIKTNENILKLLRNHRHYFTDDDAIRYYIRDSDLWQSYKRRTITELLSSVGKDRVALGQNDIPGPLFTAVEFGEANRRHSSQSQVHRDDTPGAPKPVEQLFVTPRLRRRSSAILTSNAAAVVKAVLLLRRTGGEFQPQQSQQRTSANQSSPSLSFVRHPYVMGGSKGLRQSKKSSTKPEDLARQKSAPVTTVKTNRRRHEESPRCKSVSALDRSEKSKRDLPPAQHIKRPFSKQNNEKLLPKFKSSPSNLKKVKTRKIPDHDEKNRHLEKRYAKNTNVALPEIKKQKEENVSSVPLGDSLPHSTQTSKVPTERLEKRNIVIKEIINTGYPGQNGPPSSYRRFPPSMFHLLDEIKADEQKKQAQFAPWLVGMAAKKWKNTLKRSETPVKDVEPLPSPSSQTPLIVIEEWLTAEDEGSFETKEKQTTEEEFKTTFAVEEKGKQRKASRTPSPLLSDVREESEEEVKKYEDEDSTKRWYTPIHEAREQSQQQLELVKKELEMLKSARAQIKHPSSSGDTDSSSSGDGEGTAQRRKSSGQRSDDSSEESKSSEKEEREKKLQDDENLGLKKRSLTHANSEMTAAAWLAQW